jgi:hypothetical protein
MLDIRIYEYMRSCRTCDVRCSSVVSTGSISLLAKQGERRKHQMLT